MVGLLSQKTVEREHDNLLVMGLLLLPQLFLPLDPVRNQLCTDNDAHKHGFMCSS